MAVLVVFIAIGIYTQFIREGVIHMFKPEILALAPEALRAYFDDPRFLNLYEFSITLCVVLAFPAQAILLTVASMKWSDELWLAIRAFGLYPMMFGVAVLGAFIQTLSGAG